MIVTALHELEAQSSRFSIWSALLLVITGIALLAVAGVARPIRDRRQAGRTGDTWPPRKPVGRTTPSVIEGEYEVVEDNTPSKPEDSQSERRDRQVCTG